MRSVSADESRERSVAVAITLAVAAVLAAVLGTRAVVLFADSGDAFHDTVRGEFTRGLAIVGWVVDVYGVEAPYAYHDAAARFEARQLQRIAGGQTGTVRKELLAEAEVQATRAKLRGPVGKILQARYRTTGGGFDVGRLLADYLRADIDARSREPEELQAAGNRLAWHAELVTVTTLGPAIAFFLAALAQAFVKRRRPLLVAASLFIVGGLAAGIAFELVLP
jgi:hypothetical protein